MEQSLVSGLVAESGHAGLKFFGIDATGSLIVEEVKGLLDLHDFLGTDTEFLIFFGVKSDFLGLSPTPTHKI